MGLFHRRPRQPKPVCGCGHHIAFHDRAEGTCGHIETRTERGDSVVRLPDGSPVLDADGDVQTVYQLEVITRTCGCRQYVGPEPISAFTMLPTHIPDTAR